MRVLVIETGKLFALLRCVNVLYLLTNHRMLSCRCVQIALVFIAVLVEILRVLLAVPVDDDVFVKVVTVNTIRIVIRDLLRYNELIFAVLSAAEGFRGGCLFDLVLHSVDLGDLGLSCLDLGYADVFLLLVAILDRTGRLRANVA